MLTTSFPGDLSFRELLWETVRQMDKCEQVDKNQMESNMKRADKLELLNTTKDTE